MTYGLFSLRDLVKALRRPETLFAFSQQEPSRAEPSFGRALLLLLFGRALLRVKRADVVVVERNFMARDEASLGPTTADVEDRRRQVIDAAAGCWREWTTLSDESSASEDSSVDN